MYGREKLIRRVKDAGRKVMEEREET